MSKHFDGDFDLLPFRAVVDHGAVPLYPTDMQMQDAMVTAGLADPFTWEGAGTIWRREAIRARRTTPGCVLAGETLLAINKRTARELARLQSRELVG